MHFSAGAKTYYFKFLGEGHTRILTSEFNLKLIFGTTYLSRKIKLFDEAAMFQNFNAS